MQLSALLLPRRRPIPIRRAVIGIALLTFCVVLAARRPKTPAEQEIELVARLDRLSHAVLARNARGIAPLLDDSFTDAAGRDKPHAIAIWTAAKMTPAIGYRPDREVYMIAPDRRSATMKSTVRIFTNQPKTHQVTAADVTTITDWIYTGGRWFLVHMHRPVTHPLHLHVPEPRVKA